MILICSGYPKSASTLLFLYAEAFILKGGKTAGQKRFMKDNPDRFMERIAFKQALYLLFHSITKGPIAVKTHDEPRFFSRLLIRMGFAKALYSIRDPRDVVLSALDHGNQARAKEKMSASDKAFSVFKTRTELYPALTMHSERFIQWKKSGLAEFFRYENVLTDPYTEIMRIVLISDLKISKEDVRKTVDEFNSRKNETLNFNKGLLSRYRNELTETEIREIEQEMKQVIIEMNYQFDY
jgi:Sulfotransferase domain